MKEKPSWAGSMLERLSIRENQIFLVLTIVIAVIAGLSAVLFSLAIQGTQHALFGVAPTALRMILVPTLVSVCTGIMLAWYFPAARGSGIPQTKAAYLMEQGRIPFKTGIGKFINGVLCVGSGHSMGPEGPSVQIGASLASTIGRLFHLSPERVQDLVPIGAAAALAAAFNTPIAAVLFTFEEIIGDMNAPLIGSAVLASVTAVVVERSILGEDSLFRVPAYHMVRPAELICYAFLGVVGGLISLLFCKGLLGLRKWFLDLPKKSLIFQPAMGGLLIGIILVFVPQVNGVGYGYVDQALNGGMVLKTMALLCFVKLFATIVSTASGNAGGIFAPSLYLGAMAGGSVGWIVQHYAPFPTGDPGAYALVGMGTLFAGIVRAPMTSVIMIFELTQDYQILVPLMVANMIAFVVSSRYQPVPIGHAIMELSGIHLPHHDPGHGRSKRCARDVMHGEVTVIPEDMPLQEARKLAEGDKAAALLVGTRDHILGVVARKKIEEAMGSDPTQTVHSLIETPFVFLYPDDSLDVVLERLGQSHGVVPVLSWNGRKLEGAITFDSIMQTAQNQSDLPT